MPALLASRSGCVQNLGIHWLMSITAPFIIVTLTMHCPVREIPVAETLTLAPSFFYE
jgi:hypothetical protein